MERHLLAGAIYLLAVQPSFAQAAGHSLSFRGVILLMVALGAAYWVAGYYFKTRRQSGEGGFRFPYPAWFVIAAVVAAIANVLWLQWIFSIHHSNTDMRGVLSVLYFLFGWVVPGTVVALAQMMQTPAPSSLLEAHNKILVPILGGYYLTMLFMNEIGSALGLKV